MFRFGFVFYFDFRERGGGREKEKHECEREASIGFLPKVPCLGIEPMTFRCMG